MTDSKTVSLRRLSGLPSLFEGDAIRTILPTGRVLSQPRQLSTSRAKPTCFARWRLTIALATAILAATTATLAVIQLNVSEDPVSHAAVLTWSAGTPPYRLYRSCSGPIAGSEVITLPGSATTYPLPDDCTSDFRIVDSSAVAPKATIDPTTVTPTILGAIDVSGTVAPGVATVWVNKTVAQINGRFTASGVPLALGINSLYATALSADENVGVTSFNVKRDPSNQPLTITIDTPANGSVLYYVTPTVHVTFSDSEGYVPSTFLASLDGTTVTQFTLTPNTGSPTGGYAEWIVSGLTPFTLGNHVLQVSVRDSHGFVSVASSQFEVVGPVLTSLSPSAANAGATVTLTGNGFGTVSDTHVYFTGASALHL